MPFLLAVHHRLPRQLGSPQPCHHLGARSRHQHRHLLQLIAYRHLGGVADRLRLKILHHRRDVLKLGAQLRQLLAPSFGPPHERGHPLVGIALQLRLAALLGALRRVSRRPSRRAIAEGHELFGLDHPRRLPCFLDLLQPRLHRSLDRVRPRGRLLQLDAQQRGLGSRGLGVGSHGHRHLLRLRRDPRSDRSHFRLELRLARLEAANLLGVDGPCREPPLLGALQPRLQRSPDRLRCRLGLLHVGLGTCLILRVGSRLGLCTRHVVFGRRVVLGKQRVGSGSRPGRHLLCLALRGGRIARLVEFRFALVDDFHFCGGVHEGSVCGHALVDGVRGDKGGDGEIEGVGVDDADNAAGSGRLDYAKEGPTVAIVGLDVDDLLAAVLLEELDPGAEQRVRPEENPNTIDGRLEGVLAVSASQDGACSAVHRPAVNILGDDLGGEGEPDLADVADGDRVGRVVHV
mmetsp:Transcript_71125/g.213938  ORF Transcript_71125/g.213938 Transcript_71125/m.213938 type:complete len:460 (-) Transcript_71125:248-1627(-)